MFRHLKAYFIILSFIVCLLPGPKTLAADIQSFSFDSFDADYYLDRSDQKTPTLQVNEILVAQFPGTDQNHGILRAIPEIYQGHTVSLIIKSITDGAGSPTPYTTSKQNDNLVLKIGDGSKYVHGIQTYKISYQMRNVINYLSDQDEFYWNINGDQWPQVFGQLTARIHIPKSLSPFLLANQACFEGASGSKTACQISRQDLSEETVITLSASAIQPYQTVTGVVGFSKGQFVLGPEIAKAEHQRNVRLALSGIVVLILPLAAGILMFRQWRRFGNDPKGRGVIVPQYAPPKAFNVLDSDFILHEQMTTKAFTAELIEQAIAGVLTIYEIPKKGFFGSKDYKLKLNKPLVGGGQVSELLQIVFWKSYSPGSEVLMSSFKQRSVIVIAESKKIEDSLSAKLASQGYFVKDPKKVKKSYIIWWATPLILGLGGLFLAGAAMSVVLVGLCVGLVFMAFVIGGFSLIMPARSQLGVETHDYLTGLKDYIKLAEADRIKYLQSPEGAEKITDTNAFNPSDGAGKIKLFEKLLPYAILFGLEKDWAKQFSELYSQAPGWYRGNWTTFNAVYFASSLGDFANSTTQTFAASTGSSGSGFSGGAGGGGGGGGGGGW